MNTLKKCHYCGGEPVQSTFKDINWLGKQGYRVVMWGLSHNIATEKAVYFWNGGCKNG